MRLEIEMDDEREGYGRIHKAGCRDLSDGQRIYLGRYGDPIDPDTFLGVSAALVNSVGSDWDYQEYEIPALMAPCARNARNDFTGEPYWS